jgi:hypothetical protein
LIGQGFPFLCHGNESKLLRAPASYDRASVDDGGSFSSESWEAVNLKEVPATTDRGELSVGSYQVCSLIEVPVFQGAGDPQSFGGLFCGKLALKGSLRFQCFQRWPR